jgi:hypothetical protein
MKYELGFYIPEDDIPHSDRRENHKSHIKGALFKDRFLHETTFHQSVLASPFERFSWGEVPFRTRPVKCLPSLSPVDATENLFGLSNWN